MRHLPLFLVGLLLVPAAAAEFGLEDEDGYPISRDGLHHHPTHRFSPEALARVQEIAVQDASDYPAVNRVGPATVYPYYPILMAEVERLALDHPDKLRVHRAGSSTAGLELTFLEIADFAALEEGTAIPLEHREVVWIDGGTHSNEYSGVYFVLAVAQWLLDGSPEDELAQWILENRHTWILPMVNPDGSHIMGRLNANLVNINRNYPVIWGGQGTDDLLNNPGPAAASEVETRVNIQWMEQLQPDYYASVHCCGNLWLYPYGEAGLDPLDNDTLARICTEALPDVLDDCGPIWSTIYPASGSSVDTAYEYTGAASFGFEMSGRSNLAGPWGEPVTFEEVAQQEQESWQAIVHAFENVHLYGAHPVVERVAVGIDRMELEVRNIGYGPLRNGTVQVRDLSEHTHKTLTAQLPEILAGSSALVSVDLPPGAAQRVTVEYDKRIMAAPRGAIGFEMVAAALEGPQGIVFETLDAAPAPASATPAVLPWAALGLALLLRRR